MADGEPGFKITSDLGVIKLNGKVESFKPLKYDLPDVSVEARLDQVARVFAPATKMNGGVVFSGKLDGSGADYHAFGAIQAKELKRFRSAAFPLQAFESRRSRGSG